MPELAEQALTVLVQKTFDGVQSLNGKVDTLLTKHDGLEARHNALEARVVELEKEGKHTALELTRINSGMPLKLGGAASGGGLLTYIIQMLAGGLLLVFVAGCSGLPTSLPDPYPTPAPYEAEEAPFCKLHDNVSASLLGFTVECCALSGRCRFLPTPR